MLIAVTCPQCGHLGFIPKHALSRSLVCSSCDTRAQFEGGEELDAARAASVRRGQEAVWAVTGYLQPR